MIIKEDSKKIRTKELQNKQKTMNKIAIVTPYQSITTLYVRGLNSPIKRYRMDEWIEKQDLNYIQSRKDSF